VNIEQVLRGALAAAVETAPGEAGAWDRFEARRRRHAIIVRASAGAAFVAVLTLAVLLPSWLGAGGQAGPVAPLGPAVPSPGPSPQPSAEPTPEVGVDEPVEPPAGPPVVVGRGTVAGRSWVHQLYRTGDGQICTRWDDKGPGSCLSGDFVPETGVNPFGGEVAGERPVGTAIEGTLQPSVIRVRLRLRDRAPLELTTKGGPSYGASAFATVLPGRVFVERVTGYDGAGKVVYDAPPYNTEWPAG
jgi:hypothetical protein